LAPTLLQSVSRLKLQLLPNSLPANGDVLYEFIDALHEIQRVSEPSRHPVSTSRQRPSWPGGHKEARGTPPEHVADNSNDLAKQMDFTVADIVNAPQCARMLPGQNRRPNGILLMD
jgi:hypothetical protein